MRGRLRPLDRRRSLGSRRRRPTPATREAGTGTCRRGRPESRPTAAAFVNRPSPSERMASVASAPGREKRVGGRKSRTRSQARAASTLPRPGAAGASAAMPEHCGPGLGPCDLEGDSVAARTAAPAASRSRRTCADGARERSRLRHEARAPAPSSRLRARCATVRGGSSSARETATEPRAAAALRRRRNEAERARSEPRQLRSTPRLVPTYWAISTPSAAAACETGPRSPCRRLGLGAEEVGLLGGEGLAGPLPRWRP